MDISKEWPEKKLVLTGSADGCVKQWNLEHFKNSLRLKSTLSHEIHYNDKEVCLINDITDLNLSYIIHFKDNLIK